MAEDKSNNERHEGFPFRDGISEPNDDFRLRIAASDDQVTAFLQGRLDASAVAGASPRILEPIRRAHVPNVIVDGSQTTYCDGAGIGLIGELRRVASLNDGAFGSRDFRGIFRR